MSGAPGNFWRDVREKGSQWGMLLTVIVYRILGRRAAEPVLWGIAAYFFLKDGRTRRISRDYLQKVNDSLGRTQRPHWTDVYRHYLSFARTSLDRFDVWTDRLEDHTFHYHGHEHMEHLLNNGQGAILLGAHLGNFDTLRALGKRHGKTIHILTDRRNSKKFSAILRRFCPAMEEGVREYDPSSVDAIFELKQALANGDCIGLLGDRVAAESRRGARRVSPAIFLGQSALFPQAPFLFAAHLECPVYLMFGIRIGAREYDFHMELFADRIDLPEDAREESLARYIAAYAARLEHYCRQAPFQWFNFYDFWGRPS